MKRYLTLMFFAMFVASCDETAPTFKPEVWPKVKTEKWTIVSVRSSLHSAESDSGSTGNAVAGGTAGLGAAALLGKTTPIGLVAGAVTGAAVGHMVPRGAKKDELIACLLFATKPDGSKFSHTYISKGVDDTNLHDALSCSLALPGDMLVLITEDPGCWHRDNEPNVSCESLGQKPLLKYSMEIEAGEPAAQPTAAVDPVPTPKGQILIVPSTRSK